MDGGAWWAAVHGVAMSQTRLSDHFHLPFHGLEKAMATHSSVLAWRISGSGEPGGMLSIGSHRVGHYWSDLAAAACGGMPIFLKSFNHKWVLNFVKGFFFIYWVIIWFFSFNLLIQCITLIYLHILKNTCIPGINPTWSWCMSFDVLLNSVW